MPRIGAEIRRTDFMDDALAKNQKNRRPVIPAQAGVQGFQAVTERLDPGLHRGDDLLRAMHG